jgi:dihydroorotate dehydrogenase (NAD+) catalytic subunit
VKDRNKMPFYDPKRTYEVNLQEGPFGLFAEQIGFQEERTPECEAFGQKINFPFGIPAGPLPNSNFVEAALDNGFDVVVYKSVRSRHYSCNEFPNVLPINVTGDLTLEMADKGVVAGDLYQSPLTITNSFGVPSFSPKVWQRDMANAVQHAKKGQLVIGSFQGTTNSEGDAKAYIQDFATTAKLVKETGAKVLEVNLSCPNEGSSHLLCFDIPRTREVTEAIKGEIGDTPLIIKMAYFKDQNQLRALVEQIGGTIQGIAAVNTIPAKIYKDEARTEQALPGKNRLVSGTCGDGIRWAGLEMVGRLKQLREEFGFSYNILGIGGVSEPQHYFDYREAGADLVMSATGAMWNPSLAQQIKKQVAAHS